jgi:polygalacturonase
MPIQTYDYVVEKKLDQITVYPRDASNLDQYTGKDAYTVIQAAIAAISTKAGGSLFIGPGEFF